ncbi:phosphoglycerate mutase-like protein [Punctularia strigosozonata HHB-11173 SS5]|uniref:phosphoglycerate mutase-like protein n=1 Tax=Punctularia strigosozonata (strain HHB-11173) TaxID=741275 RepID=UPI00044174AD|nr:phosphoglycerate mutase-like protein [Punctularia strigosozonata HHB-11173 SS5]EIN12988.1 phosphoglycerate mutase-like protein [Punctularia strigosozonata HHB-11173 SS5]
MSTGTPMITFTFIRHGESTDNLRSVWAGWSDAPLSNHGMNQARALAEYFSETHFSAVYASDLLRARTTAETLRDSQPAYRRLATPVSPTMSDAATSADPPPFVISPLLREQNFGLAEGRQWSWSPDPQLSTEEHYMRGVYPAITERSGKFPQGESLDELAQRADRVLDELLLPEVHKAVQSGERGIMIAVVSHGLCISELMAAFMRRDSGSGNDMGGRYRGMMNTAWHRISVELRDTAERQAPFLPSARLPPLIVRVTHINQHDHLDQVKRQKAGIGSSAYDPKQRDIRAFFGGAGLPSKA